MIAPVTLLATLFLSGLILAVNRRHVVPIYIVGMCFVPADQAVVIAGLDFKVLRILALVGCMRVVLKMDKTNIVLNKIDKTFIFWSLSGTVAYIILRGTSAAVIYKMGVLVDLFMIYFVFRCYLRDPDDLQRTAMYLVVCLVFLAPLVLMEQLTGKNPFAIMGRDATSFREGRIRCSAAFSHAILLGSFSASVVPLAIALFKSGQSNKAKTGLQKAMLYAGIVCSIYVTIGSASSGPLIALMAGLGSMLIFKYRFYTGMLCYFAILLLTMLHFAMEAPVWHLISRIDLTGSSTGYHRFYLIDQSVKNFMEWALIGVHSVEPWGVHWGDVTSMYIAQGVSGGFLTMVLFFALLIMTMRIFWQGSMKAARSEHRWLLWAYFSAFVAHSASFLSVAYFGQIGMLLTLGFATAAMLQQNRKRLIEKPGQDKDKPMPKKRYHFVCDDA